MTIINKKVLDAVLSPKLKELHKHNKYAACVDWSVQASEHRFFLIDLEEKEIIYSWWTSHGAKSGGLDKAISFSNVYNSHKTSLGIMKAGGVYQSRDVGFALKLHGLEPGINDNVFKRGIVIHSADYVTERYMKTNEFPGRSHGCITLDTRMYKGIIDKLKGGSLIININSVDN